MDADTARGSGYARSNSASQKVTPMTTIGIVGAGVAGLHLALYLQKQGIGLTLYAERSADEVRAGRMISTQAFMGTARARDVELGVAHWDGLGWDTTGVRMRVAGNPPIAFTGALVPPNLFIDMRIYLPRLMEDFVARGGALVVEPHSAQHLGRLAQDHELVVVATGREGLSAMFPRRADRSPYHEAQRILAAGLFRGVRLPSPIVLGYELVPGCGEILEMPILASQGCVTGILVEAIPGGPFEPLARMGYEGDPRAFDAAMIALVREHMPDTFARVDPAAFAAVGVLDTLFGAVVPVVRRGFIPLPGGRFAIAIGDAHVTFDPLTGQGANAAYRSAWLLGELVTAHVRAGGRFDEAFCASSEERVWEVVRAAAEWTNAFLQPPPPHVIGLLVAAAQDQALADAFASGFDHPDQQWALLSSPEAAAACIAGARAPHPS